MKYIVLIFILILNSCTGSDDRVKRPLNELIYDDKEIKKDKKQVKKDNKTILKKSTISILKHHVYEVQNFTSNKENLWSHIECGIILSDIKGLLFSKKYLKGFVELFKLSYKYPIKLIAHTIYRLKKFFLF